LLQFSKDVDTRHKAGHDEEDLHRRLFWPAAKTVDQAYFAARLGCSGSKLAAA
jgi:hypothetical protein